MPATRVLTLIALVIAAAGITVLGAALLAPTVPGGVAWAGLAALVAAAALRVPR